MADPNAKISQPIAERDLQEFLLWLYTRRAHQNEVDTWRAELVALRTAAAGAAKPKP